MRPEDYRRFKPELWLQDHNPNPVPFNDLAVLQSELELRRRREIYRQSSQRRAGSTVVAVFLKLYCLPGNELWDYYMFFTQSFYFKVPPKCGLKLLQAITT
jgi:hypothetical protein